MISLTRLLTVSLIAGLSLSVGAIIAEASCTRIGNYVTCDDGSNYQTFGNTTQGYNAQTGSTWSQQQIGNNTYGTDSQGNSWSAIRSGNSTLFI